MSGAGRRSAPLRARAFAPGHVTGLFSPAERGRDPRARGSVGAGIVLELGAEARATWWPDRRPGVRVVGEGPTAYPISTEVARRLVADAGGSLEVSLAHQLPVGQGFGMSAAGALATALSVAAVAGVPRQKAIEVAHLADLFGGGGLGGVASIVGGGLEVRERPGIPPYGSVRHRPFSGSVVLAVVGGPIPSPPLLRDPRFLRRVRRAAEDGLAILRGGPSVERFLSASEEFTDRLRLAPPGMLRTIRSLRSPDVRVAQAMFGRSLFAVPRTVTGWSRLLRALERAGLRAIEIRAARRGAIVGKVR